MRPLVNSVGPALSTAAIVIAFARLLPTVAACQEIPPVARQQEPAVPKQPAGGAIVLPQPAPARRVLNLALPGQPGAGTSTESGAVLASDRTATQRLAKAKDLLQQKQFSEAVQVLGSILEASEDFFFQPDKDKPVFRSLKAEAERLIGQMPREGRESYELQFGSVARQLLDHSVRAGDPVGLAEASRRFFHTQAGYEATNRLGAYHLDHGRPLVAALCFERLRGIPEVAARLEPTLSVKLAACWALADMPARAGATIAELKRSRPQAEVVIGSQRMKLPADVADATDWLTRLLGPRRTRVAAGAGQWTMFRGGPARNTPSLHGGMPFMSPRWRMPVSPEAPVTKLVEQLREQYGNQSTPLLPSAHPLVVNDLVLTRTATHLVALDCATGSPVWEAPVKEPLGPIVGSFPAGTDTREAILIREMGAAFGTVPMGIAQRLWGDATFGTLASDGAHVFSIEDLGLLANFSGNVRGVRVMINNRANPSRQQFPDWIMPKDHNRLVAHELRTGRPAWQLGGPKGDGQLDQSGTFFLGPPLVLEGRLYAIAEASGEIRLLSLDAKTGRVEWAQPLVLVERNVLNDPQRRYAGVSPSYGDGVLVCPTGAGAVVAIDLSTRSLLWGYTYTKPPDTADLGVARALALRMANGSLSDGLVNRWADSLATVSDGSVLLTPRESSEIHCLNLLDGSVRWTKPRGDALYVAAVHDAKVLIAGTTQVQALRLADGRPAWPQSPPIPRPSGRGFASDGLYYLPLSTGEVAAVDMSSGRIVARAKSPAGQVPGNLVCAQGVVVSQGTEFVEKFGLVTELREQIARSLEANPDDPEALALRGEFLLADGKVQQAVVDLRRSLELKPDPRVRTKLFECLLEDLRSDFAANRDRIGEIETLVDRPDQQVAFVRAVAAGLRDVGAYLAAFDAYFKLADLEEDTSELDELAGGVSARRDRWLQARMAELRAAAGPAERAEIDRKILARLEAALSPDDPAALPRFLKHFGSHPAADAARSAAADRLIAAGQLLQAELLLQRVEQGQDAPRARFAVARQAGLLNRAGATEDAARYYRRLQTQFAREVCLDGKTGRQLIDELPAGSPLRRELAGPMKWPEGLVETTKPPGAVAARRSLVFPMEIVGGTETPFTISGLALDLNRRAVVAYDGLGRQRWEVPLVDAARNVPMNAYANSARINGHLVLVSLGQTAMAIDPFGTPGQPAARVLWTKSLVDSGPGDPNAANTGFSVRIVVQNGQRIVTTTDQAGNPLARFGPVTGDYACMLQRNRLTALEPLTGRTTWTRTDTPEGSSLFGDDELLFVAPPGSSEATVLRGLDGIKLGERTVPPPNSRLATVGRLVLASDLAASQLVLRLADPWTNREVWRQEFAGGSRTALIGREAVAVLEPKGRLVICSMLDGSRIIDDPDLPAVNVANVASIHALRWRDQYLLVTNRPETPGAGHIVNPGYVGLTVNGEVHAFDCTSGKRLWTTPVQRQNLIYGDAAELPVLVFSRVTHAHTAGRSSYEFSVLCLDKRNGRVLVQETGSGNVVPGSSVELSVDPDRKQIELLLPTGIVKLTFTDKPIESAEAAPAAAKTEALR